MITKPHTRPFTRPFIQELASLGLDPLKVKFYSNFDIESKLTNLDSGNDGTIVGASWVGKGRYGVGLYFDGVDDHVEISKTGFTETSADGKELSVFMWSKIMNNQNDKAWIGRSNTGVDLGWRIIVSGGASSTMRVKLIEAITSDEKDYTLSTVLSTSAVDSASFYHTGFTFNGNSNSIYGANPLGKLLLYVNGVVDSSPTVSLDGTVGELNLPDNDVTIGDLLAGGGYDAFPITAIMDSVLIYAGELTPNQIQNLYNAGL